MEKINQSFYNQFQHVQKRPSDKKRITNYFARQQFNSYIIKVIKIPKEQRQTFQIFLKNEVLESQLRKKRKKSQSKLFDFLIQVKQNQQDIEYFLMRNYYDFSLKELLQRQNSNLMARFPLPQLTIKLLDLFVGNTDINHVLFNSQNILFYGTKQNYTLAVNFTAISDYMYLQNGHYIKEKHFYELLPYLYEHVFLNKNKFNYQLKLHCFAVVLLQIILKKNIIFKVGSALDPAKVRKENLELTAITSHYLALLNQKDVKNKIAEASQILQMKQSSLADFFNLTLVLNSINLKKMRILFSGWAQVIQLFLPNYLRRDKFIKQFSLDYLINQWQKQTEYSKKQYKRWGIMVEESTSNFEQELILYGKFKFQKEPLLTVQLEDDYYLAQSKIFVIGQDQFNCEESSYLQKVQQKQVLKDQYQDCCYNKQKQIFQDCPQLSKIKQHN